MAAAVPSKSTNTHIAKENRGVGVAMGIFW